MSAVACEHGTVARYDVNCPLCGIVEVSAPMEFAMAGSLACSCGAPAPQVFTADHLAGVRIDAGGEDSPHPQRRHDGTAGINLGLKGIDTVVGQRADGKPKLDYRPLTNHEVGSNRKAREIAKQQGLIPMGGGRYRSLGSRSLV
jgi:hypothetical protein